MSDLNLDSSNVNDIHGENIKTVKNQETESVFEDTNSNDNDIVLVKKKSKLRKILDSDSSEDENNINDADEESLIEKKSKSYVTLDSEDSNVESFNKNVEESSQTAKSPAQPDSDEETYSTHQKSRLINHEDILKKYAESESSEEETITEENKENNLCPDEESEHENEIVPPRDRSKKIQRRSAKQAEENMLLIQSQTQKLFREAEISVPYHKPRQCSLREFLSRKKIQKPHLKNGKNIKASINMRGEELLRYAQHLEERAKEAELFFKTKTDVENLEEKIDSKVDNKELIESVPEFNPNSENLTTEKELVEENELNIEIINQNDNDSDKYSVPQLAVEIETESLMNKSNDNDSILNDLNVEVAEEMDVELVTSDCIEKQLTDIEPVASTSKQIEKVQFEIEKSRNVDEFEILDKNAFQKLSDSEDDELIIKDTESLTKTIECSSDLFKNTPRLSGCPGMVIDLEDNRVVTPGVGLLMQRFVKHAKVKPAPRKPVIKTDAENIPDGIVVVNPDEMEANTTKLIPGIALQKLRNELQARMAQRRSEEFNKRLKQQQNDKEGYEPDILDDDFEENEDELELEISSSEDENETSDKKTLLEDEAEVDEENEGKQVKKNMGIDEDEEKEEGNEDDDNDDDKDIDADVDEDSEADDELSEDECLDKNEKDDIENIKLDNTKKIRKRLQVMDSSDSEDENDKQKSIQEGSLDIFQTQNENEIITLHQTTFADPQTTPQNKMNNSMINSELKLTSPGLFPENTPITPNNCQFVNSALSFEINDDKEQVSPAAVKRLFSESLETSQKNELFTMTQNGLTSSNYPEDELLELCSGKFPTQQIATQAVQNQENESETPQDSMKLILESDEDSLQNVLKTNTEENIGKEMDIKMKKKQAKVKPLQFSDEDESDKENENNEEIDDEFNDDDEFSDNEVGEVVEKLYEYDSEENEVEIDSDRVKEVKAAKNQAREFLENEAELSESEWGSADEDERGLDTYDCELGDEDVIDTKKVRGELERIHIRQVLDEDKREVRLLQELLLEDGENHGDAVRERKFKWKNADDGFSLDQNPDEQEGEGNISEEEDQTEWRKNRFEREKVLREKQIQLEEITDASVLLTDTLVSDSFTEKKTSFFIKKKIPEQVIICEKEQSFLAMGSIKKQIYRGSFLKRDEATLSRLSALTKTNVDDSEGSTGLGSTGKGNFVFSTISPAQAKLSTEEKSRKRAPVEDLCNVNKKVKKSIVNKKLLLDYLE